MATHPPQDIRPLKCIALLTLHFWPLSQGTDKSNIQNRQTRYQKNGTKPTPTPPLPPNRPKILPKTPLYPFRNRFAAAPSLSETLSDTTSAPNLPKRFGQQTFIVYADGCRRQRTAADGSGRLQTAAGGCRRLRLDGVSKNHICDLYLGGGWPGRTLHKILAEENRGFDRPKNRICDLYLGRGWPGRTDARTDGQNPSTLAPTKQAPTIKIPNGN